MYYAFVVFKDVQCTGYWILDCKRPNKDEPKTIIYYFWSIEMTPIYIETIPKHNS